MFDVARYPEHLSIAHLAAEEKDKIRTGINRMKDKIGKNVFDILEEALNENPDDNYKFEDIAKEEQKLDKYFKQDFWDIIQV